MTDIDLHQEFDRLDSGISDHPDLAGLWAGGQRRRRRTRALWTAGALATAAVVAPLALLVGGGADTAPTAPGFASEPTAVTTEEGSRFDARRAAVLETFPPADGSYVASSGVNAYNDPIDGEGLYWRTGESVWLTAYAYASGERLPCPEVGCEQVGDRNVVVVDEGPVVIEGAQGKWIRTVQVFPTDPARTDMVEVSAAVSAASREEADATLPSAETLTALALDERLPLLISGEGVPEPTDAPTDVDPGAEMTAAVTERFPDAQQDATDPSRFTLASGVVLNIYSGTIPEDAGWETCEDRGDCETLPFGGRGVSILRGHDDPDPRLFTAVHVMPARATGPAVDVWVRATSTEVTEAEAEAQLPSAETLTELALDERLVPPAR